MAFTSLSIPDDGTRGAKAVRKYSQLLDRRRLWEREWRDLADFIVPRKSVVLRNTGSGFGLNFTPGDITTRRIFSSSAIKANEDLASSIQGTLTNAAVRWFTLKFPFEELNTVQEAAVWLEEVADRMFLEFQQSNFNAEINEAYIDLGGFGISAMFMDEDDLPDKGGFGGFRFKSLTIGEYAISENASGRVDTIYRAFQMSLHAAVEKWGAENLSQGAQEKFTKNPFEQIQILHCVFPRDVFDNTRAGKRRFASLWVEFTEKHLINEGGFEEFPYMVPRWAKNTGEEYGRGPGHTSLPDVRTLNRARQLKFRQWAKAVDPPMEALEEGVIGQIQLTPSSLNFVRELNSIQPIESKARFDVASVNEQELISSIKEIFFSDLTSLPPAQGTPMSATEAAQRFEIMQRKLGPTIGRLKSELLQVMIDRGFGLMARADALPEAPQVILDFFRKQGVAEIRVEFEGPLERAQRSSDLVAIERTYQILIPVSAVAPEVFDVLDHDGIALRVAEVTGLPQSLVVPPEEVAQIRAARAEAQQKAAEAEQSEKLARAAKSGAGAVSEISQVAPPGPAPAEEI